jgi:hypothetical protein
MQLQPIFQLGSIHRILKMLIVYSSLVALPVMTQQTPNLQVDVCKADISLLQAEQSRELLSLVFSIAVKECEGKCIGSLEFTIRQEINGISSELRETAQWNWREGDSPFELKHEISLHPQAIFDEVSSVNVGRCSCLTPR